MSNMSIKNLECHEYEILESHVILDNVVNLCILSPQGYSRHPEKVFRKTPRLKYFLMVDGSVRGKEVVEAYYKSSGKVRWDIVFTSKDICYSELNNMKKMEQVILPLVNTFEGTDPEYCMRTLINKLNNLLPFFVDNGFTLYNKRLRDLFQNEILRTY